MNLRPISLLCGFALVAAVPALADRMPDCRYTIDSASTEIHAGETNDHAMDARDQKSFLAADTVFPSSSNKDAHSLTLTEVGSFEHAAFLSQSGKAWEKDADGDRDGDGGYKKSGAPTSVPEPGSLSLLLIGLSGIGLIASRRGKIRKIMPLTVK
jgi:hypothetical protein